jgi:ubiquinone/menaquinone biosynthesis C-methylase UbiE
MPEKGYADVTYLETAAELFQPVKERSYEMLRLRPGMRFLDVGCGPGTDTLVLARRLGSRGEVVGVDSNIDMVATAERRASEAGLADRVRHLHGYASDLPFPNGMFDGCRAERLFIHLRDPLAALEEMIRVTRTGGRVVAVDTDFASLSFDTTEIETERCLIRVRAERLLHNGYSGRQLYRLFQQSGLTDVRLELFPIPIHDSRLMCYLAGIDEAEREAIATGLLSDKQVRRFHADLEQADRTETFFGSGSVILVSGCKG